jgi:hypothetical protein
MAQHHGFAQAHGAKSPMLIVVQIRPANPAGSNADADISDAQGRDLLVFDSKVAGGVDNDSFHRMPLNNRREQGLAREMRRKVRSH